MRHRPSNPVSSQRVRWLGVRPDLPSAWNHDARQAMAPDVPIMPSVSCSAAAGSSPRHRSRSPSSATRYLPGGSAPYAQRDLAIYPLPQDSSIAAVRRFRAGADQTPSRPCSRMRGLMQAPPQALARSRYASPSLKSIDTPTIGAPLMSTCRRRAPSQPRDHVVVNAHPAGRRGVSAT